jgi:hypothetical protein
MLNKRSVAMELRLIFFLLLKSDHVSPADANTAVARNLL